MKNLLLLFLLASPLYGQQVLQSTNFTTPISGVSRSVNQVKYHQLAFAPNGTVTTCTVRLLWSPDNVAFSTLIPSQKCTTDSGSAIINLAGVNYIQVIVDSLVGGGSVDVSYRGWYASPAFTPGIQTYITGTPYTPGALSCFQGPNTVGDCTLGNNKVYVGVNTNADPSGGASVVVTGQVVVNSATAVVFTQNDVVCISLTSAGTVIDNGKSQCSNGQSQVGSVAATDSSPTTSHVVLLKPETAPALKAVYPFPGMVDPPVSLLPLCNPVRTTLCAQ